MSLLWQKPGVEIDGEIQAYLAGDDVLLDRELFAFDIEATRVHAQGLERIGVLRGEERSAIERELSTLLADFREGTFVLDERFEDCHSAIESRLIERLGDTGRRVHTGRSRNDQVLVATRLWMRSALETLSIGCCSAARVCLERAQTEQLPLPGYTHLQRAMVSSTAMWWAGWAEAFIDDAHRARATQHWVDANPLGSAAGYGVNLPLDRAYTTEALGFGRMTVAATYAQLTRGKYELAMLEAVGSAALDVRRLAWDLSLFSMAELGFVRLPPKYVTGSSLMPNKRNPDVLELMRAGYAVTSAARSEIEQVVSLPSGYHRDLQVTKGALIRGTRHGLRGLSLVPKLLEELTWVPERMRAALEPSMYATDLAIELARSGVPFRDAYVQAAEPSRWVERSPEKSLEARTSPGAAGNLALEVLQRRLEELKAK